MAERLQEFLETEELAQPMIVGRGVLPAQGKMIIGGAPKSNKSFLALNMALDLAMGQPLFCATYVNKTPVFPVYGPKRVLYLDQELGNHGAKKRLRSMIDAAKINPTPLDFYIKTKHSDMRLDTEPGRAALAEEISESKPDVLFLDPLAKFHLVDENSAQHMGAVMRIIDRWIQTFGCSVVIIHHTALAALDPTMHRRGGAKLRGSSAVFADTDTFLDVQRESSAAVKEPLLKLNFELRQSEPIEPIRVKRLRSGLITFLQEGDRAEQRAEKPRETEWIVETPYGSI